MYRLLKNREIQDRHTRQADHHKTCGSVHKEINYFAGAKLFNVLPRNFKTFSY